MKKNITICGSTGSIGKSTLEVVRHLQDELQVVSLACHSNIELLQKQIIEFRPKIVAVFDEKKALELKRLNLGPKVVGGQEGILEATAFAQSDFVMMAIVGLAALEPTICAIEHKKQLGLANKEVLVSAGELIMGLAAQNGVKILPVDSEHNAIFQCLDGKPLSEVRRIILTASGGPFRTFSEEQLSQVTLEQALNHPTWSMGPKVTVDSSTLMNKGLEVMEAYQLFGLPLEKIEVVVHPQSLVHSFVEWVDGSIFAQISEPKMTFPIQHTLTYPKRVAGIEPPFDFTKHGRMDFFAPDTNKFLALALAFEALKRGKSYPCYLNATNEVLVDRFLKGSISWVSISRYLEKLMDKHCGVELDSVESICAVDQMARREALNWK